MIDVHLANALSKCYSFFCLQGGLHHRADRRPVVQVHHRHGSARTPPAHILLIPDRFYVVLPVAFRNRFAQVDRYPDPIHQDRYRGPAPCPARVPYRLKCEPASPNPEPCYRDVLAAALEELLAFPGEDAAADDEAL